MGNTEEKRENSLWKVLLISAAACLIYGISSGFRANYGVMLNAIMASSGLDYAAVSFVMAVGQLAVGVVQPLFGALALKKSNSYVLCVGAVMMVTGLIGIPMCHNLITLTIMLGIVLSGGTGAMAFGIVMGAITPAVGEKAAAVASGFISASSGIVGTVLSPVLQQLIDHIGLRNMMLIFCIVVGGLFLVSMFLGRIERQAVVSAENGEGLSVISTFKEAISERNYLFIFLAFFTCGYHMSIIETHLYSHYLSFGFSDSLVALALSVYGIGAMTGCIVNGFLCARFPNRIVLACTYWSRMLIIAALLVLPKTAALVYITAFLFGCSGNATVPPTSGLITRLYGAEKLGILFGTAFLVHQVGAFLSSWFGGILLNATGGYTYIWMSSMVLSLAAGTMAFLVRENKQ